MPDIAMCKGEGRPHSNDKDKTSVVCPKRETCLRFKATPSEFRQVYFLGIPYDPGRNECQHFLPMTMKEVVEKEFP
jgi:hypothetical protein